MADPDDESELTLIDRLWARSGVLIGVIGLVAWFAMLWFMFGDVL
jgi:hypothetical protein